jgi:signal transduction histidine kinase
MVGHDIRNPLLAIIGDIFLLNQCLLSMPELETRKEVAESLDNIETNVNYINKIVADLQDYSRSP